MSENTDQTVPAADAYTVNVTVLEPRVVTVTVPKRALGDTLPPSARAGIAGRIDSLMQHYIEKNRAALLPDVAPDAVITRTDVK